MTSQTFPPNDVKQYLGTPVDAPVGLMSIKMRTSKYYTDGTLLQTGNSYTVDAVWGKKALDRQWAIDNAPHPSKQTPAGFTKAQVDLMVNNLYNDSGAAERAKVEQEAFLDRLRYPGIFFDPGAPDDTGDGSLGDPYQLVTAARIVAGHRHVIKAGSTITTGAGTWLLIPTTGLATAPIIFDRYGDGEDPIINGALATKIFRGDTGAKYVKIFNIEISAVGAGADRFGISIAPPVDAAAEALITYSWTIAHCTIHGVGSDAGTDCEGIKLYGAYNIVMDCEIYDIADDGIWFHGYYNLYQDNTIYLISTSGRAAGDNIQAGSKCNGTVVRGNYLDHRNADSKQCIYFEQTNNISDNILIEDNICLGFDATAGSMVPLHCGATNSIVRRNFVTGGIVGILISAGGRCHHNLVLATVGRGIDISDSGVEVFHNTVIQTGVQTGQTLSVGIRNGAADYTYNKAYNNIIAGFANSIVVNPKGAGGGLDETNNCFYTTGGTPAHVRMAGTIVPPKNPTIAASLAALGLDTNYRPSVGSVVFGNCRGAVDFTQQFDKDYRAFETQSAAGCFLGL